MDFEQRIEKLTERHEALTQTIELMMHETNQRAAEWNQRFSQIVTSLEQLTHIAEIHQSRLDRIEGV